jgi:Flp pilus assembly protein TadG
MPGGLERMARKVSFARDERGSSAAEFALVLPLVIALIFGPIAVSLMMYMTVSLQHTTETAARCLSAQRSDCSVADITTFASALYKGPHVDSLKYTAKIDSTCGYLVTATGTFTVPFLPVSVPITTSSCYDGPGT